MLEIACDESGSEGDKLIGGNTEVFAHASVVLSVADAAECVRETRDRIRSPATEYKANHLLREKHRRVLVWLLSPDGPISGHARVYVADKALVAAGRMLDLLGGSGDGGCGDGGTDRELFHRDGLRRFGAERWTAFLGAFNDMVRGRAPAELFYTMAGEFGIVLRHADVRGASLDPLLPAVARAIESWGALSVVHDQQNVLTGERIAHLVDRFGLAGFRLVDSFAEPRVQVADYLAGVARKIAERELNGLGDPELTALLRPFVDPSSVWVSGAASCL